ncbi:hypothetical protein BDN70DRAFT_883830 [Pholiota conissans]|uniref:Uncharacterized protein n=1 Tax=Pholiota conissans TaxID=109636 RepID=A0A9P5YUG4_9AGAR|nr:hypothetical protein BDN70DRAFT_883830 [Pholiota conissans]
MSSWRTANAFLSSGRRTFQNLQQHHPHYHTAAATKIVGIGLLVVASSVIVPTVGIAAVHGAGFLPAGIAANSCGAIYQSYVCGGATTGLVSTLQSFGATAAYPAGVKIVSATVAAAGGFGLIRRKQSK